MNRRALLLLVAVVLVWGANWPIMKVGVSHIQPLWFAVLRLALGAACLFAVLAVSGRLRLPQRGDWPVVLSIGLIQMTGCMALVNLAIQWVPAGRSAILAYTTPLWVVPGAWLLLGERLGRAQAVGVALGLAGVGVLFNPLAFDWSDGRALAGNGLLLASAALWGLALLHVRGHDWRGTPLELAPWQMLVGLVPLSLLAGVVEGGPRPDGSTEFLLVAAYNGPLATAFAFWAVVTLGRLAPAVTVSLALLAVPVAGLLISALMLGEPLGLGTVTGLALIISGVVVATVTSPWSGWRWRGRSECRSRGHGGPTR